MGSPALVVRKIELDSTPSTIGALFAGWGISMLVFGVFILQFLIYFTHYTRDSRWRKLLVLSMGVLEVAHQIFVGHTCWKYIVRNFGNEEETFAAKAVWSFTAIVFLNVVVSAIVKIFLAWRIYIVSSGHWWWTALITMLAFAQMALGIAFSIAASKQPINSLIALKSLATASLALGAVADVVAASILSYYLHTMRTGYKRTEGLINKLIMFSVNTGAITSAFSVSVVILYQTMPHNFIFLSIWFFVSKLYSNSLLATLNSRAGHRIKESIQSYSSGDHALTFMRPRARSTADVHVLNSKEPQPALHISVSHEVSVIRDDRDDKVRALGDASMKEDSGHAVAV
ncbi:unnamed protein product [Peniophora sp. CBMAI 1063]|nr:unnamed protein product [Peniophora sp. CBMAI 1063]